MNGTIERDKRNQRAGKQGHWLRMRVCVGSKTNPFFLSFFLYDMGIVAVIAPKKSNYFLFDFLFFCHFGAFLAPGSVQNVPGIVFGAGCTIFRHFWLTERQNGEKVKSVEWPPLRYHEFSCETKTNKPKKQPKKPKQSKKQSKIIKKQSGLTVFYCFFDCVCFLGCFC